ncbi:Hypothetical predicted protein [Mytilus galloprovincialis]|nr:Hypothetical predicted protein [Mytilus galloprovincialis]
MQSMQDNSELSDVIISLKTDCLIKGVNKEIRRFGEIVVQTSESDMSLVRQKIQQAQAKVDDVTKGRTDHHYETIQNTEDPCFIVTVQPDEDALKFGLNGQYRLCLTPTCFVLEDIEKMTPQTCWPYNIVRKFGVKGITKNDFSITVGRRNVLGVGTVDFVCNSRDDQLEISRIANFNTKRSLSKVTH